MSRKTTKQPTDAQLKAAYATWKQGGISIWGIKKTTGILARILLPAFEKLSGKRLKSPAAKLPATKQGKKAERAA